MKFIEDYLTELFGVDVCNVRLHYAAPTNIIASYSFADDEYTAYRGGCETIVVTVSFSAFSHDLPHRKGSLLMESKHAIYSNVSDYTYICVLGEETKKLFEYAPGKEE